MKLIGIMPCRNEEHVLGLSARVALRWCDSILMLVHASTDRTAEIASEITCEFPNRAWVAFEKNPKWDEMEHREQLLLGAREHGASHIAIVDADEIITGNLLGSIRQRILQSAPGTIVQLPGYNLRGSLTRYHGNGVWGNRWFSVAFADDQRLGWHGDRFHAREPMGLPLRVIRGAEQGQGGVMHLWAVDERRLRAKHRRYRIEEAIRWPHKSHAEIERLYSMAAEGRPPHDTPQSWTFAEVPKAWWAPYQDLVRKYYHPEIEPWQDAECARIISQYGMAHFAGLNLS